MGDSFEIAVAQDPRTEGGKSHGDVLSGEATGGLSAMIVYLAS